MKKAMDRRKLQRRVLPYATLMGMLMLLGDYLAGPYMQFPIFFILPVILVAWDLNLWVGIAFGLSLPLVRLGFAWQWNGTVPWTMSMAIVNTSVRITVLIIIAYLTAKASRERRFLQQEVRTLQGLLRICMHCKKIANEQGEWQVLEDYIMHRAEVNFTHGLCPSCIQEHYGHYLKE
jgi:hypothetical protein